VTYLPCAGSLESESAAKSPGRPANLDRPASPDSHADPASRLGTGTPLGPPAPVGPPPPATLGVLGGRFWAGGNADSGAPGQAALGQRISSRLFSVGLDLNLLMRRLNDEPGVGRLEHAITEIDDAIKDLRHLMLAITQRLA
jgi:hypothetical protein